MFGFVPPPIFAGWKKLPSTPLGITVKLARFDRVAGGKREAAMLGVVHPFRRIHIAIVENSQSGAVQAERILGDEGAVHHHRVEFLLLPGCFDARAQPIRTEICDR
jgi:hypothetical protein